MLLPAEAFRGRGQRSHFTVLPLPALGADQEEIMKKIEEMTRAALNVLSQDPDGFLLVVAGGAIDWASRAAR